MMKLRYLFWQSLIVLVTCFSGLCAQVHHSYASEEAWQLVTPYLMPENHPLKSKLDKLFAKKRVLQDPQTLADAGFEKKSPRSHSHVIVTRHKKMKGYIFKIYTDNQLTYYRNEPEYITWMFRARGAKLVSQEVKAQGWEAFFKAPKKWIYPLPPTPRARSDHLQKNFILVEEEMDLLSDSKIRKKWRDGTITKAHLNRLFYLVTKLGLRGGCKYDNIPICKDGKLAFIDTQNNLRWPLPYDRLYLVLEGELRAHWDELIKTESTIPRHGL